MTYQLSSYFVGLLTNFEIFFSDNLFENYDNQLVGQGPFRVSLISFA